MSKTKRAVTAAVIGITVLGALALQVGTSGAGGVVARAELKNQAGVVVGDVVFKKKGHDIVGVAEVTLPTDSAEFHGFHIHADNGGTGCVGDFTSVGGHWDNGTHSHGAHLGDLPVLMRDADGRAKTTFAIGKFEPADIIGRAVIVHAGPDNYANIPTRYQSSATSTPPGPDATTKANGDAGGRYACGVLVSGGDKGKDED